MYSQIFDYVLQTASCTLNFLWNTGLYVLFMSLEREAIIQPSVVTQFVTHPIM